MTADALIASPWQLSVGDITWLIINRSEMVLTGNCYSGDSARLRLMVLPRREAPLELCQANRNVTIVTIEDVNGDKTEH